MRSRVGALSRASLRSGEERFREREGEEMGGRSSLRISGAGVSGAGVSGAEVWGLGLEDSFSDSELSSWSPKSLRSRWDVVTGLEAGDEGRDDERGRFLGVSGGFGLVPGSAWEWLGVPGSGWEWPGWPGWPPWQLGGSPSAGGTCAAWRTAAWAGRWGPGLGGKRGTMGRVGRGAGAPGRLGMEVGSGVVE